MYLIWIEGRISRMGTKTAIEFSGSAQHFSSESRNPSRSNILLQFCSSFTSIFRFCSHLSLATKRCSKRKDRIACVSKRKPAVIRRCHRPNGLPNATVDRRASTKRELRQDRCIHYASPLSPLTRRCRNVNKRDGTGRELAPHGLRKGGKRPQRDVDGS